MMMMNNRHFYNFPRITVAVLFKYVESITKAILEQAVWLKRLITSVFESSEPLLLLRLMGVSAPSLYIEPTNSMIYM